MNVNVAIGEQVRTSEGETIGRVSRFVVDLAARQLTAVVIDHGPLSAERVAEITLVKRPAGDELVLAVASDEAKQLPPFAKRALAWGSEPSTAESAALVEPAGNVVRDPYQGVDLERLRGDSLYEWPLPDSLVVETISSIPESSVVLGKHTAIVSSDGYTVGHLHGLAVDGQRRIAEVVTTSGLIYRQHLRLPASTVVGFRHDRLGLNQRLDEVTESLDEEAVQMA